MERVDEFLPFFSRHPGGCSAPGVAADNTANITNKEEEHATLAAALLLIPVVV